MAWSKGAGPAYSVRRRSGGHTILPPVQDAPPRDAYGRKLFGVTSGKEEVLVSDPNEDALHSLRGAWKPFAHWQRQQELEQEQMAWLSSSTTADFDLDLTSQPGPLSQEPLVPPSRRTETPETPATPEIFQQGGLGQGTWRDPRRGPRRVRQARWTANDAAPKPTPDHWHRRMEEELRREEERAEQEAFEERQRAAQVAEAAARERIKAEAAAVAAAARAAAEAARAARARSDPFAQSRRHKQRSWKSSASHTDPQGHASSQPSKEEEDKANAERAQRQERESAARKAKAAAEADAARKREQEKEEKCVAEHESLYLKFERAHDQESSPATITLASVPFPPSTNPLCLRPGASEKEKKAALRKASLRWHPDKFTQRFGKKIAAGQSEAIHAAVTSAFQSINAQRENI